MKELPGFRLIPVNKQEQKALKELSKKLGISEEQVFRQALMVYQLLICSESVARAFEAAIRDFEHNLGLLKYKTQNKED